MQGQVSEIILTIIPNKQWRIDKIYAQQVSTR
jgi:hypothetical protein